MAFSAMLVWKQLYNFCILPSNIDTTKSIFSYSAPYISICCAKWLFQNQTFPNRDQFSKKKKKITFSSKLFSSTDYNVMLLLVFVQLYFRFPFLCTVPILVHILKFIIQHLTHHTTLALYYLVTNDNDILNKPERESIC